MENYLVFQSLLDDYDSGKHTPESFLGALDRIEITIQKSFQGVIHLEHPEGEVLKEASVEGLRCLMDAVQYLRDYHDSGEEVLADEALEKAYAGCLRLREVAQEAEQSIQEDQDANSPGLIPPGWR